MCACTCVWWCACERVSVCASVRPPVSVHLCARPCVCARKFSIKAVNTSALQTRMRGWFCHTLSYSDGNLILTFGHMTFISALIDVTHPTSIDTYCTDNNHPWREGSLFCISTFPPLGCRVGKEVVPWPLEGLAFGGWHVMWACEALWDSNWDSEWHKPNEPDQTQHASTCSGTQGHVSKLKSVQTWMTPRIVVYHHSIVWRVTHGATVTRPS